MTEIAIGLGAIALALYCGLWQIADAIRNPRTDVNAGA